MIVGLLMVQPGCKTHVEDTGAVEKVQVAVMVTEGFHDAEAYMPLGYLTNRGAEVTVIGPLAGIVKAYNSDFEIVIEKAVTEVSVDDFDALVLPGGKAPAALREDAAVVDFARRFFESGKVTAAICHGPQLLITAGVMTGKKSSGTGSIREELEAVGATYLDEELVIDGNLITSRVPSDLNAFSGAIGKALSLN